MIKRNLLVMGLAVLLSACGFQLRGTGNYDMAFKELDLSARNAYGETVTQLRQVLQNSGVEIHTGAPYKLVLTNEQETQRSLSYAGAGRSTEFELTSVLNYQILSSDNLVLLDDKMQVQKVYIHDGSNLVGTDQEANEVRKEMRRDLVQRMVLRLQLLQPEQLQQLEQMARNKAKADADALEAARKAEAETPQQSPMQLPNQ